MKSTGFGRWLFAFVGMLTGMMVFCPVISAQPKYGGILVVGSVGDMVGLDPHMVGAEASVMWLTSIYERLVDLNENSLPMPGLAKKWTISKDGLTYTFHLREGVKFHNGREMTSEDVVYSYNRMLDPKTKTPYVSHIKNIKSFKILDKYTVQFIMHAPMATFLIFTANPLYTNAIVPKEEVEKQGGILNHPVGTGPYKFVEYVPDRHLILERFKEYKQPGIPSAGTGGDKPAYVDRIKMLPIKDASVRIMALKKGDIDYNVRVPWEEFDELKKHPEINAYEGPGLASVFLGFGVNSSANKFVRQAAFRRAVGYCLDLQEVVEGSVFGHSTPNPSLVSAALPFYSEAHKKGYGKNIKKAKDLLKEVGYDGSPIRLSATKLYLNTYKSAVLIEQMLAEAGINVKLDIMEWPALLSENRSGKYDMQCYTDSGPVDPSMAMRWVHSKRNSVGYKNDKLDAWVEKAEVVDNFEARKKLYEQIHEIYLEDAPTVKLYDHSVAPAARKQVKGIGVWPYLANLRFHLMWLDK
jgi:peptide/nickel transport system substrate-binding protein